MTILGIHDGHTAAAALLRDGCIVAAAQEERFTRIKNWAGFPAQSVRWVLQSQGLGPADVEAVVLNGSHMPYAKSREEILNEYERTGAVGTTLRRLLKRTAVKTVYDERRRIQRKRFAATFGFPEERIHFVEHHTAHAAGAYYGWGRFDEPILVLTNDGAGDGLCASVSVGEAGRLRRVAAVPESESIGNVYAMITFMMGMVPAPYMILSFDTTERVAEIASAIHPHDRSVRPHIVSRTWNPDYHHLLEAFRRRTGRGAILNTSFNLHGYPIVNTPEDALDVLKRSGLQHLLLGHFLVHKTRRGALHEDSGTQTGQHGRRRATL